MLNAQTPSSLFLPTNKACSDNTTQCLWTCFSRCSDFSGCVTTSPPSPPQTRTWALAHREVVGAGSRRVGDTAPSDSARPALCWRPVATGRRNSEARLGCPVRTGAQTWAPSPSDSTSWEASGRRRWSPRAGHPPSPSGEQSLALLHGSSVVGLPQPTPGTCPAVLAWLFWNVR